LLDQLTHQEGPLERKLSPTGVKDPQTNLAKLDLDEKQFRWMMNEDAMATEKLAEGIRTFAHDLASLRKLVDTRLAAAA
jgi:transaldolase